MGSPKRPAGPRAMLKNQQYRSIAEQKMEIERERIRNLQNDSPAEALESSSMSAQIHATDRLVRPSCLNVSSENDLKNLPGGSDDDAVTYWSHELKSASTQKPHFSATPIQGSSLFAKCTAFTNDITDSRFRHSEGYETVSKNN